MLMFKMGKVIFFLLLLIANGQILHSAEKLKGIVPSDYIKYVIVFHNGDILSGYVIEIIHDKDYGAGIRFDSELYEVEIFESQIRRIYEKPDDYGFAHRIFLLPTADPIGDSHFAGVFELLFLYGGFGISDIVSVTAGRSFIPLIPSRDQVSVLNIKATLLNFPFETIEGGMSIAVGGNLAYINHNNRLTHGYAVATFRGVRSRLTGGVFYKFGQEDYYRLYFGQNALDLIYENGSFGIALGLDTQFPNRHDLHFIGEIWNSDVTKPTNTAVLLGLRLRGNNFAADFGFAVFTQPLFAPFASFSWAPFR